MTAREISAAAGGASSMKEAKRARERRPLRASGVMALAMALSLPISSTPARAGSFDFLNIGAGARGLGLGGAGAAAGDSSSSAHWNPAGVGGADRHELSFMHGRLFEEFRFQSLGYAVPVTRRWNAGLNAVHFSRADIQGFDDGGAATRKFDVSGLAAGATLAGNIGPFLGLGLDRAYVGATVKHLREDLGEVSASGQAVDLGMRGVLYDRPSRIFLDKVQMGLSVSNLGPAVKFEDEKSALPLVWRAGLAARFLAGSLLAAADHEKPRGDSGSVRAGLEYQALHRIALRGGWRQPLKSKSSTLQNGLHLGMGFQVAGVWVDYAYVPFQKVDDTHFIGVRASLGGNRRLEQVEERLKEHYNAARLAYARKDFARAQREIDQILTVDPSHSGARRLAEENKRQLATLQVERSLALGKKRLAAADYGKAREHFQSILSVFPQHVEAGVLLRETDRLIGEERTRRREALAKQGEEFYRQENYQAAIDLWEKVLLLDPGDTVVKSFIGRAQEKLASQKKAATAAAERESLGKGFAFFKQKKHDKARAVAQSVLKANPESEGGKLLLYQVNAALADDLVEQGRRQAQARDHQKAFASLQKALQLDPENKIAGDLMAKSRDAIVRTGREEALNLYSQQKYKEALEKLDYLVQVDPNAKDLADYRQEAQRKLAETRRVQADIYNREGLKAYSEGNFRAAVNHWKKVLEIYPDHPSAKRNLERVKQELRELP